jgi:hypothetical protein
MRSNLSSVNCMKRLLLALRGSKLVRANSLGTPWQFNCRRCRYVQTQSADALTHCDPRCEVDAGRETANPRLRVCGPPAAHLRVERSHAPGATARKRPVCRRSALSAGSSAPATIIVRCRRSATRASSPPTALVKDPPFSRLDLISCRNVLIYLEEEFVLTLIVEPIGGEEGAKSSAPA